MEKVATGMCGLYWKKFNFQGLFQDLQVLNIPGVVLAFRRLFGYVSLFAVNSLVLVLWLLSEWLNINCYKLLMFDHLWQFHIVQTYATEEKDATVWGNLLQKLSRCQAIYKPALLCRVTLTIAGRWGLCEMSGIRLPVSIFPLNLCIQSDWHADLVMGWVWGEMSLGAPLWYWCEQASNWRIGTVYSMWMFIFGAQITSLWTNVLRA